MIELARLQLKRDRLLAAGMAASLLASLPVAWLAARADGLAQYSLQATILFWVAVGLPGFAVLFGGSAGAELASTPSRAAELLLPVSPSRRAWGGLLGAALNFLGVSLLVGAAALSLRSAALTDASLIDALVGTSWWWGNEHAFTLAFAGSLPYFLLASFLGAYLFRHGVLGGLLGTLLGGAMLVSLGLGLGLEATHPDRASFGGICLALVVAASAACGLALHRLAPWAERKPRASGWVLAGLAGLAALGALASAAAFLGESRRVKATTRLVEPAYWWFRQLPRALPVARGVVLQSLDGELFWATEDGRRTLLARNTGFNGFVPTFPHTSVAEDAEGNPWILVEEPTRRPEPRRWAVWAGNPARELELKARFTHEWNWVELVRRGRELGLMTWNLGYAPIPALGRQPEWRGGSMEGGAAIRALAAAYVADGAAAELSADSRTLIHRPADGPIRTWRLPGRAMPEVPGVVLDRVGSAAAPVFLVRLFKKKDRPGLARCFPDGRVETLWEEVKEGEFQRLAPLPAGGYRLSRYESWEARFIGEDGELSAPSRLASRGDPLRYDGSRVWLVSGASLEEVEIPSGRRLKVTPLPKPGEGGYQLRVVPGGFFLHTGAELEFVAWDGTRRRLGK